MNAEYFQDILTIWQYHQLEHQPSKCDCIIAMGSNDLRVADRAAELYLNGIAPLVVVSGGFGRFTEHYFEQPEADLFSEVLFEHGVPESAVLIENHSTNTGENVRYSWEILKGSGHIPDRVLLVHKPYMERRAYSTFLKQWPQYAEEVKVTSPKIDFLDFITDEFPIDNLVDAMLGDLLRIRDYPERGFQIEQVIPENVWQSYRRLVALAFQGASHLR
ncbi:hypothetical protein CS022_20440 [Veronia nyctiphanis]|uniref:DUF218 domain-containing protein n=1 Tax=Veronia nyctiphanis TaxID=1278244 RepID=A0A4V1LSG1_9GAMM|nr:YdcF family protein [Veronia nyctiphanis]RXJ71578.1 hypothetical protein CS022_20440 [Veronia nyctiphanis]